jgi:hypothetical protein
MKFLSDILARAGLVVDGTVTLNSVANATTDTDKFLTIDSGVVKFRTGAQLLLDIGGQVAGSYVPTSRILTINGTAYDLSADRSWTITAGVSSVSAGTGIAVNSTTGAVTVTNTGLLSATAGSGISVTTTSGTLNIVNTGLLSGLAGSGISVTTSSGTLTINNTGLLSGLAGSGISVTTSSGALTITNTGILSAVAGAGISVSTTSGTLTITNTITNNNQLTNGAGYITGYTETDTLATVTGRGATTSTQVILNGGLRMGNAYLNPSGDLNHFHFNGTAIIPNTTTTASNASMGTSAYRWSVVYGGGLDLSGSATISGSVTASSIIKSGGTSSQFLKADGSVDSTTYQSTSQKGQANGYASLDGAGKVPIAQLPSSIMEYKGTWNASTNSPSLADGTGDTGDVYRVSTAGTRNLGSGSITFDVGDYVIYNGTIWEKSDTTDAVASVNGLTGVITLTTTNIGEGTNLYYTDARARAAITLTTTGTSGAATYSGGVLNIPQYQSVLTNPITGTGTTNYLTKFTGTTSIGNSQIFDNGTNVAIGTTSPGTAKLHIRGQQAATKDHLLSLSKYDYGEANFHLNYSNTFYTNGQSLEIEMYSLPLLQLAVNNGATQSRVVFPNGNVGIGTASPSYKLQVVASSNQDGFFVSAADSTPFNAKIATFRYAANGNDINIEAQGGKAAIQARAGASTMDLLLNAAGGYVGIGTTTPATPLHVLGGPTGTGSWNKTATLAATYPGLIFNSNGTKWGGIAYDFSAGMRFWVNASNDDIFAATNAVSILNNGNVGINSSAPTFKLEVGGTTYLNGNVSINTNYNGFALNVSGTTYVISGHVWVQNGYGYTNSGSTATGMYPDSNHNIDFKSNNSSAIYINSSRNIGINTTSPVSKLEVYSNLNASTFTGITVTNGAGANTEQARAGIAFKGYDWVQSAIWHGRNTSAGLAGALVFGTNPDTTDLTVNGVVGRMWILNNGNVGIATSSPAYRFQVQGPSGDWAIYAKGSLTANNSYGLFIDAGTSAADSPFMVRSADGTTTFLRIQGGGNIGILTASPANKLQIGSVGSSGYGGNDIAIGNGTQVMSFFQSSTVSAWYTNTNFSLMPSGAGAVGNLGLGTTTPSNRLTVSGNADITGRLSVATTSTAGTGLTVGGSTVLLSFAEIQQGNIIYFYSAGNTSNTQLSQSGANFYINTSGNVGIATNSPADKLHVSGGGLQVGDSSTTSISFRLSRTSGGVVANAHYFTATANTPVQSWIEGGFMTGERAGTVTAPNSGYPYYEEWIGNGSATAKTFGFVNLTSGNFTSANLLTALALIRTGQIRLPQYTSSSSFTGTAVATLGVDSSGNVITVTGVGSESDTLATVTNRGNSTSQTLFVDQTTGGGYVFRTSSAWGGWARHAFSIADGSNNILSTIGGYGGSGTSIAFMYIGKSYTDFSAAFNPDGNVEFRYDNSTRLTIDSVGISVSGRTTSGWGQFSSSTQGTPIVKAIQEDSSAGYYLFQGVTGSTEVFRVDRLGGAYFAGNVGIGTSSPGYKLEVNGGAVGNNIARFTTGGGGGGTRGLTIYSNDSHVKLQVTDNAGSAASWAYLALNPDGGNVGVGTTSPAYKLDVTGEIRSTQTVYSGGNFEMLGGWSNSPFTNSSWVRAASGAGIFLVNNAITSVAGLKSDGTFYVSGASTFASSITCVSLTETSTIKVKENIVSIDSALDQVEKLQAVSYNRKGSSVKEIGLIAEAVEEVYPEFVQYDQNGEPVGLNYSRLTAVLIESVKELKNRIQQLEKRN